jgi:hypothetical protein
MSCDTSTVTPPGSAVWYDLPAVTADVLAILRLTDADVDAERIETLVPAAAILIDQFLDRPEAVPGPPPSPPITQALNQLTIEMYRRKDVPFDTVTHILGPIRSEILHAKQRWGVA